MRTSIVDMPIIDRLAEIQKQENREAPCEIGKHAYDYSKSPPECSLCGRKKVD